MHSQKSNPVTVLHVVGGTERAGGVMHVATQLAREGVPMRQSFVWKHRDFLAVGDEREFVCEGNARYTDRSKFSDLIGGVSDVMPLVRWIRRHRNVILHAHSRLGTVAASLASRITGCPLLIHLHGTWTQKWLYRALIRFTGARVVFNSGKTCRYFGFDPANSAVVMPDIEWPVKPALAGGATRFVAAGSFVPVKNLEVIIRAFEQIDESIGAKLVLFGRSDQPLDERYQSHIISLCAANPRIEVKGYDPLWASQLCENDVLVHAAEIESFGIVILEAFARGCRCVVPGGLFLDEFAEPLRSTGVYRAIPATVANLRAKMEKAVRNPASAEALWQLRRTVADEFSIKKAGLKLSTVYESMLH